VSKLAVMFSVEKAAVSIWRFGAGQKVSVPVEGETRGRSVSDDVVSGG
jgi:hypothetical protein